MKKKYINPITVTIKVETQNHMLFGSTTSETTINGGGSAGDYDDSDLEQLSRGGGFFDD